MHAEGSIGCHQPPAAGRAGGPHLETPGQAIPSWRLVPDRVTGETCIPDILPPRGWVTPELLVPMSNTDVLGDALEMEAVASTGRNHGGRKVSGALHGVPKAVRPWVSY